MTSVSDGVPCHHCAFEVHSQKVLENFMVLLSDTLLGDANVVAWLNLDPPAKGIEGWFMLLLCLIGWKL